MPINDLPSGEEWETAGKSLVAEVPDYDDVTGGNQTSYWRLGAAIPGVEAPLMSGTPGGDNLLTGGCPFPGWLEYTDGHRTIVTRRSHREVVGGDKVETIAGRYRLNIGAGDLEVYNADPVYKVDFRPNGPITAGKKSWRKYEWAHNSTVSYSFGDVETFFGGYKFDAMFGLTNNIFFGGKIDLVVAASLGVSIGYSIDFGIGVKYSRTIGKDLRTADDIENKAREKIHFRIKTTHTDTGNRWLKFGAGLSFVAGAATAGALAGKGAESGNVDDDGFAKDTANYVGTAVLPFTAGLVGSLIFTLLDKAEVKMSKAEVKIEAGGVKIADNVDLTGAPLSWINVGLMKDRPHILLETTAENWIELQPNGDIVANAGRDLHLQGESGRAMLKLLKNGTVHLTAEEMTVKGKRINMANVFQIRI